jgi:CRP-like cAMP-binding protein
MWKVDQVTFRYLLAHHNESHRACVCNQVKDVDLFAGMDESSARRLVSAMVPVRWKAGDRIVQKGERGEVFYLIRSGEVKVHDIGLGDSTFEDQVLRAGQSFGERALLTGEVRAANVTALTDVTTLAMDRQTFEESIGPLQGVLEREMRRKMLSTLPILAHNLSGPEIDHLVPLLTEVCYPRGFKLAEAGKGYEVPTLWFVRHGRLLIYNVQHAGTIYEIESGDHFGDDSIQNTDPGWVSTLTAVCEDNVTAWMLTRSDIEHVIGDLSARLARGQTGETPNGHAPTQHFVKHQRYSSFVPSELTKHGLLGMGAFGKVYLVSHRRTSETFALKSISKRKLLESHQMAAVKREKELLQLLSHPFILHLVSSFQDEENLYLVLPLVPGGELFSVLQKRKSYFRGLPSRDVAFYGACVIEGLGHFHQRSVAYRDLKLENILIGEDGYCVIVDLGFAKLVVDKTYTLVGTPEYLAPDVLLSRGYDKSVDYWSYGVLMYELLVGKSPFYQRGSSQIDMFKRIVKVEYACPDFVSPSAADMVKRLLCVQAPRYREHPRHITRTQAF